jgi:hypothetical protein
MKRPAQLCCIALLSDWPSQRELRALKERFAPAFEHTLEPISLNMSYQLRSGTKISDATPDEILAVCTIHNHKIRVSGTVKRGTARRSQP